jgi:hypothetical protein
MPQGIPEVTLEITWGPREATLDECARASARFLKRLGPFFSGFEDTRLVTVRKKRSVELNVASLREVLRTGVNRTDVGHEVIVELGYSVGLTAVTATDPGYDVDVSLNIGVTAVPVPNEVSIALGTFDPVRPDQVAAIDWVGVFELLVDVWSPLYGSLLTSDLMDKPRLRRALRVGWLTYLSAGQFPELPVPAQVPVKPLRGVGHLIDCMPERFPQHTKKDVAAVNGVHRALAHRYLDVKSL